MDLERILSAVERTNMLFSTTLHRIESKTDALSRDFSDFKEVCHNRQSACQGAIHGRINDTAKEVAHIKGRLNGGTDRDHKRSNDSSTYSHGRKTVNQLKDYWAYILLFLAIGAVIGDHIIPLVAGHVFGVN